MTIGKISKTLVLALICFAVPTSLMAVTDEELAQQIVNPVAALISVPLQNNYDRGIGPEDDGMRYTLNIQPVIPFQLSRDWNLITRTIAPVIYQKDIFPDAGSQTGIGDIMESLFFSPVAPTAGGWIWGVGPVFVLPTGSDDLLTMGKWCTGPTAVLINQQRGWTYGALANHIWSFAGDSDRADVSATFLQPFVAYTTPTAWTYVLQSESLYDWENEQWTAPLLGLVSKVTTIGKQRTGLAFGIRYYLDAPESGPEGFGFRFNLTLMFPKSRAAH